MLPVRMQTTRPPPRTVQRRGDKTSRKHTICTPLPPPPPHCLTLLSTKPPLCESTVTSVAELSNCHSGVHAHTASCPAWAEHAAR